MGEAAGFGKPGLRQSDIVAETAGISDKISVWMTCAKTESSQPNPYRLLHSLSVVCHFARPHVRP
jgi:hypothetical protein